MVLKEIKRAEQEEVLQCSEKKLWGLAEFHSQEQVEDASLRHKHTHNERNRRPAKRGANRGQQHSYV